MLQKERVFMKIWFNYSVAMLACLAFFAGSVFGGIDPDIDPSGSDIIQIDLSRIVGGDSGDIQVVSQVYAPGEFSSEIDDYVYTYQLFNNSGEIVIGTFKVGVAEDAVINDVDFSSSPGASDIAPLLYYSAKQEVVYMIFGAGGIAGGIAGGEHSALLWFSSPYGPTAGYATVTLGSSESQNFTVETPVPEPMTLLLLAGGFIGLRSLKS